MKEILEKHKQKQETIEAIQSKFDYLNQRLANQGETTADRAKLLKDFKLAEKLVKIAKVPNSKEAKEFLESLEAKNLKFAIDWKSEGVPRLEQLNQTRAIQKGLVGLIGQEHQRG